MLYDRVIKKEFSNVPKEERKRKEFKFPPVVPIVLYNGKTSWTPEVSFKKYFACGEKFGNAVIDFTYLLLDLTQENEEFILSTNNLIDNIFSIGDILPPLTPRGGGFSVE